MFKYVLSIGKCLGISSCIFSVHHSSSSHIIQTDGWMDIWNDGQMPFVHERECGTPGRALDPLIFAPVAVTAGMTDQAFSSTRQRLSSPQNNGR